MEMTFKFGSTATNGLLGNGLLGRIFLHYRKQLYLSIYLSLSLFLALPHIVFFVLYCFDICLVFTLRIESLTNSKTKVQIKDSIGKRRRVVVSGNGEYV